MRPRHEGGREGEDERAPERNERAGAATISGLDAGWKGESKTREREREKKKEFRRMAVKRNKTSRCEFHSCFRFFSRSMANNHLWNCSLNFRCISVAFSARECCLSYEKHETDYEKEQRLKTIRTTYYTSELSRSASNADDKHYIGCTTCMPPVLFVG